MSAKNQILTKNGARTPRAVIYKSESHKLHQAFVVKEGSTIYKGQPVALETDGTISPYTGTGVYLGIATTDSIYPAYQAQRGYPLEVTIMVEGYAVCHYVANAAIDAGYVKPTATIYQDRYVTVSAESNETHFIALNKATAANELVQVLIR